MAEKTKIEWATHTFNPFIGCTKVSPGCDNCYAEAMMDKRYGRVKWGPHGERVRTSAEYWKQPLRWAKKARDELAEYKAIATSAPEFREHSLPPHRPRVFCASLADVFDNQVPPEWRHDLWRLIWDTPELDWLLLTKRPENITRMLPESWLSHRNEWKNVWLGVTCEDQERFNHRWPILRAIPAAVRFISYEPAIGPLTFFGKNGMFVDELDWLICGGESGPGYRAIDLQWEADIRRDCAEAGVNYFFKQLAGKRPIPPDFPIVREFPTGGLS
jgi:protein gp37